MKNSQRIYKHAYKISSQMPLKSQQTSEQSLKFIFDQEIDPAFAKRAEYIITKLQQNGSKSILDVGCGRGYYIKLLSLLKFPKKIVGVDIKTSYLSKAREITKHDKRVSVQQASIYELPFKNNSFDAVICSEILEHLDNEAAALKEIYRILRPQGVFLISVPHQHFPFLWDPLNWVLMRFFHTHIPKHIWWLAGIWADHERLYTKKQLTNIIQKQKFTVVDEQEFIRWCWPFTHFLLYGLGKNIVERMGASEFDRFNVDNEKPLSRFLARLVRLPSVLLDKTLRIPVSQTLVMTARK